MNTQPHLETLQAVYNAKTFGDARAALGAILQIDSPAPDDVTARTLIDQKYASMIATLGKFPEWREKLMNDPYNAKFLPPKTEKMDAQDLPSTSALIKKAAGAVLEWGTSGFASIDPWELERRRQACMSCDQLAEAPGTLLYQAAKAFTGKEKRICRACGCLIAKKVALQGERCPMPSQEDPSVSRWGGEIDTQATPADKDSA